MALPHGFAGTPKLIVGPPIVQPHPHFLLRTMREYVIYTDESVKEGRYYSNFYGGALVRSSDLEEVNKRLASAKALLHFRHECKWGKVSKAYLTKYVSLVDTFFDLVEDDRVKVRIMFTQNRFVPLLTPEQRKEGFFILYYQFFKHAFGLSHSNGEEGPVRLRINMDQLTGMRERRAKFKGYLAGLEKSAGFRAARVMVPLDQIAEVKSHDHDILQCLDIVLGSMQFRLNDRHKEKPAGSSRRAAKTIAKEKLYKRINERIRRIHPGFNVGANTGRDAQDEAWRHQYRHWLFRPYRMEIDPTKGKRWAKADDPAAAMLPRGT